MESKTKVAITNSWPFFFFFFSLSGEFILPNIVSSVSGVLESPFNNPMTLNFLVTGTGLNKNQNLNMNRMIIQAHRLQDVSLR